MADQVFENGENVLAILNDLLEDAAQAWFALGLAIPFCKHSRRDSNIPPKFFRRMAAKKQSVKESSFALREFKVLQRLVERIGLCSHTRKPQFTDFVAAVKAERGEKGNIVLVAAKPIR